MEEDPIDLRNLRRTIWLLVLATGAALFLLTSRWGINLGDGGYYYYAVLRILAGEIPGPDFQAYDPLRYYWSVAWAWLLGDQLLVVRLSRAAYSTVGIAVALSVAAGATRNRLVLAALGLSLFLIADDSPGIFVIGVTLAAVYRVLDRPTRNSLIACAFWIGLAGGIGHNFALYGSLAATPAFLVVTSGLATRKRISWAGLCVLGAILGYAPMLGHMAMVPGFLENLWTNELSRYWQLGTTNIPLPVPWPWTAPPETPPLLLIEYWARGSAFLLLPLVYLAVGTLLAARPSFRSGACGRFALAATLVGLPYLHYVFSRADMSHMRPAMLPAALASFALLVELARGGQRRLAVGAAAALIGLAASATLGASAWLHARLGTETYVAVDVRGSQIMVRPPIAAQIEGLRKTVDELVATDEAVFIGPHWPMMYCILDRRSPTWQNFHLYRRPQAFQQRMIRELEAARVRWIVLSDAPMDNREDRRFSHQLPTVWNYIQANFQVIEAPALPPPHKLYRRTREPASDRTSSTLRRNRPSSTT